MPSEAQLARVSTISDAGKVANKTAIISEAVRNLQTQQSPALCCNLFNTNNVSIPSGAWTSIAFSTATYDGYGMWAVGVPTRITCVAPGKYVLDAGAEWASSVSNANGAGIRFLLNGTTVIKKFMFHSCDVRSMSLGGLVHFSAAGEYLQVQVIQNTGGAVNIVTASLSSPTFGIHKYG